MKCNLLLLAVCLLVVGSGAAYLLAQSPTLSVPPTDVFAQGAPGGHDNDGPGGPGESMPPGGHGERGGHGDMGNTFQMIGHMGDAMFNPRIAGVIAIGGLKDAVGKKLPEKIKFFEAQLDKTKTLGLRNAIRLTLKDLYHANGDDDKIADLLKAMLEENDAAIGQDKAAK
jgi:hypothetical protein